MKEVFKKRLTHRMVYGLMLLAWISLNVSLNIQNLDSEGSFGIIFIWVFLFPALIFLVQIIFNSWLGWFFSVILYSVFSIYVLIAVTVDVLYGQSDSNVYTVLDYLSLFVTVAIILSVGYILFRIKPVRSLF